MKNPQKEDGHTDIANELIEALARIRIPGESMQCLWIIFRKTYGWKKKKDRIALSQFARMTGLKKQAAHRGLSKLAKMGIITVNHLVDSQYVTYEFVKDYSKWKPSTKLLTVNQMVKTVNQMVNEPSTKRLNTKESRQKKLTKERLISTFKSFWSEYPKKDDKKNAIKIWFKKIQPENGTFEKIMTGLEKAKQTKNWQKENGQYIPLPSTWLNGERWNDEPEEVIPYQKLYNLYHSLLPELPSVDLTKELKAKMAKVWRGAAKENQNLEWWKDTFLMVKESKFLCGKNGDWSADLNWLMSKKNNKFNNKKVCEGLYSKK